MLKSARSKVILLSLGLLAAAIGAGWFLIGPDWRALVANPPKGVWANLVEVVAVTVVGPINPG